MIHAIQQLFNVIPAEIKDCNLGLSQKSKIQIYMLLRKSPLKNSLPK